MTTVAFDARETSHMSAGVLNYSRKLREWLRAKYGSLETLGKTWGRYSYETWEDVEPPGELGPFAESLDWLEKPGRMLWIGVWSENFGAQKLYGRLGFEKVGEYEFPVGGTRDREFILRRG